MCEEINVFNNSKDYLTIALFKNTCFLGIGSNRGVYFVQDSINNQVNLK
jgi:hypothetical protein